MMTETRIEKHLTDQLKKEVTLYEKISESNVVKDAICVYVCVCVCIIYTGCLRRNSIYFRRW